MFSYFKHSAYRWFATEVIFLLAILMDKKKNPSAETNFFFHANSVKEFYCLSTNIMAIL